MYIKKSFIPSLFKIKKLTFILRNVTMFFLHNETFDNCKKKKFVLFIQNTVICFFDKNHNIYDLPYMPML